MAHRRTTLAIFLAALGLAFGACGDDDTANQTADTVDSAAEEAAETAEDIWASFRTGFEGLVDEAATGDSEAQEQLLEQCRDTLRVLRQADDPRAERVGQLCDDIRDADDQTAWDELRQEVEDIDAGS